MGTTIEDAQYEIFLEEIHNNYIKALEELADSESLSKLRENLDNLQGMKANLPSWMTDNSKNLDSLDRVLEEINSLEKIYSTLIKQGKESRAYFFVGLIVGLLVTLLSSLWL